MLENEFFGMPEVFYDIGESGGSGGSISHEQAKFDPKNPPTTSVRDEVSGEDVQVTIIPLGRGKGGNIRVPEGKIVRIMNGCDETPITAGEHFIPAGEEYAFVGGGNPTLTGT